MTKALVAAWKEALLEKGYAPATVNGKLTALDRFLTFWGWEDCRVKHVTCQRKLFREDRRELTREEYFRLVNAASGKPRLMLLLETICATGIRVSEVKYITLEAARQGRAEFTAMAMRFTDVDVAGANPFSDVPADAWYQEYVVDASELGWIGGYPDGTFRPDQTINRAEVTTIVNRMLGRVADEAYVDAHQEELAQFSDVVKAHWAYYQIVEATNAHEYTKDNNTESWTELV